MNIRKSWNYKKTSLTIVFTIILWGFFLSGAVSAASISLNGPSSVTESSAGGAGTLDGNPITISEKVNLTLSGDTYVSDLTDSSVRVIYSVSGDCGLQGGKDASELLTIPGSKSVKLHTSNNPYSALIYLYPTYNPNYTGTRTCTLTFTHDAATSSNAEIVSLYGSTNIASYTINILDAQSPPPTSTPSSNSTSPSSTPTSSPEESSTKPPTPAVKLVDNEGNELEVPAEGDKPMFKDSEPIVLSGTTVPNGEVKLYIFSEPQEANVTADENGVWTYTIENLESGDHRVEVEVTDPVTGETSERAEVLAFSVAQAEQTEEAAQTTNDQQPVQEDSSSPIVPIVITVMLLLAIAAGAYWFIRKKKTAPNTSQPNPNVSPPNPTENPTSSDNSTSQDTSTLKDTEDK